MTHLPLQQGNLSLLQVDLVLQLRNLGFKLTLSGRIGCHQFCLLLQEALFLFEAFPEVVELCKKEDRIKEQAKRDSAERWMVKKAS